MADFTQIIQEINADINTNGVGAITGAKLNEVLRDMIDAVNAAKADILPDGSVFGGFVTSNEPIPHGTDNRYYYIATQQGTYTNFGGFVLDGNSAVMFYWDEGQGSWGMNNLYITANGISNELQSYVNNQDFYTDMGFPSFDYFETYNQGDFVVYHGVLYQFNAPHSGAWTGTDVDQTDLFTIIGNNFGNVFSMINDLGNNKADKVTGATVGDFAGLDNNGNLTDSGSKASDFATAAQGGKADTAVQPSDLATVATSGSYNDLLNKPTIPAAQVNSDWNADSGVSQILNKPTIPDVSGKADKVVGATSGDVATLDGNGNLTDSGLSVFDFFVMVEDASTPPESMSPNTVYQYGTLSGNTTFPPLATPTEPDIANVYCWTFTTPATAPTITWPVAITAWAGGSAPTINASKSYEVSVMDGLATIIES